MFFLTPSLLLSPNPSRSSPPLRPKSPPKPLTPEEIEYQKKLEEQKKLRQEVLRKKEANRLKAVKEKEAELAAREAARNSGASHRPPRETSDNRRSDAGPSASPSDFSGSRHGQTRDMRDRQHPPLSKHPPPARPPADDSFRARVQPTKDAPSRHASHGRPEPPALAPFPSQDERMTMQRRQILDDLQRNAKPMAGARPPVTDSAMTPSLPLTHAVMSARSVDPLSAKKVAVVKREPIEPPMGDLGERELAEKIEPFRHMPH